MQGSFKRETSFEKRVELAIRIREQYNNRVPIIVEMTPRCNLTLGRRKYIVPVDVSIGGFLNEIRTQTNATVDQAIFLFCGANSSVLVPTTSKVGEIYHKYKDEDGFLYMVIALEDSFGTYNMLNTMTHGLLDYVYNGSARIVKTLGFS